MKTKKYLSNRRSALRFLFAVMVLIAPVTGCEDQLETKVFSQLTPDNFYKSEGDFNSALVALYNPFTSDWGNSGAEGGYVALYNANNRSYLLRSLLTTDEMENGWDMNLEDFNWQPATFVGTGGSAVYYRIAHVARATSAIDKMSQSTANIPDAIKNNYIAQAKTLRAWLMYILYDFYGPVNARWDPATLSNTEIEPRPSEAEYLAQIEKDLTEAMPDLKDMYNDDANNWGRVSKGVARMLLLKLYMHTKQWDKAEAMGKEIIGMGYELMDNYADIFKVERNKEVIFAVASSASAPNWYPQHVFPNDFASHPIITRGAGWYGYSMPWAFFDKFNANDLRRTTTIIASYTNANGGVTDRNTGLRGAIPLKYTGITGPGPSYPDDVVVFRLGEVYLSVAEAINEQRGPDDAYAYVNPIRQRAGVADFSGMTQDQFRDAILDERGRELYAEGTRRQDLIRHGKFISNAVARGKDADPWEVHFPIPADVINQSHGVIAQNDGYTE